MLVEGVNELAGSSVDFSAWPDAELAGFAGRFGKACAMR